MPGNHRVRRILWLVAVSVAWIPLASAEDRFELDIPAQAAADAITSLSFQTRHSVLFQTDDMDNHRTQAVKGEYSIEEALSALLEGTDLTGGLTESGVIVVSRRPDTTVSEQGRPSVTNKPRKRTFLAAVAAVFTGLGSGSVNAQDLSDGLDEIVVVGTRSSITNSLEAKRNAESIVDVLSADDADKFPDNNLAEALSRIPGISFQRDNNTSDGTFISIRGLDASYNTVLSNGIRIGTADSFRRTSLSYITGDGLSSIRITKAPLPEDASAGIGGVVDIRTQGALERSEGGSFGVEARDSSFDDRTGYRYRASFVKHLNDDVGFNISASARRRYNRTFQIDSPSSALNILRPQSYVAADGSTVTFATPDENEDALIYVEEGFIAPEDLTTEEARYRYNDYVEDNINVSGTIDWIVSDRTSLTFGGIYSRSDRETFTTELQLDSDAETGSNDVFMNGQLTFEDPEYDYRAEIIDRDEEQYSLFIRGETETNNWEFDYIAGFSNAYRNRPSTRMAFSANSADIDIPGADDPAGANFAPFAIDSPFILPNPGNTAVFNAALNPFTCPRLNPAATETGNCFQFSDFRSELTDSAENDRASLRFDAKRKFGGDVLEYVSFGAVVEDSSTEDIGEDIGLRIEQLGLNGSYLGRQGSAVVDPPTNRDINTYGIYTGNFISFDDVSTVFTNSGLMGLPEINTNRLRSIRDTFATSFRASGDVPRVTETTIADEQFYTGYVQTKLNFGDKFNIVGGIRLEQYEAELTAPTDFSGVIIQFTPGFVLTEIARDDVLEGQRAPTVTKVDNFTALPRILGTYNVTDRFRIRGGYTTSIARPEIELLAGSFDGAVNFVLADGVFPADATLADLLDIRVRFNLANPNLENSYSNNFDLSFEYYWNETNAIYVAGFYKRIDDFIFSSFSSADFGPERTEGLGTSLDDVVSSLRFNAAGEALVAQLGGIEAVLNASNNIEVGQAKNGETATVYGIEIGGSHTFDYLPGIWSNFGVVANLTLQESEAELFRDNAFSGDIQVLTGELQADDPIVQSVDLFNAPDVIGNIALFYDSRNIETALSYRHIGTAVEQLGDFGAHQYTQSRDFLDFNFEYKFNDGALEGLSLTFEANDVLDGGDEATVAETYGRSSRSPIDNATFNGRNFRVGANYRF